MQPAERVRKVPATKMASSLKSGRPSAAIHSAHRVGHSSSRVPIGLSARISCNSARVLDVLAMIGSVSVV